jgi:hypothetical protein
MKHVARIAWWASPLLVTALTTLSGTGTASATPAQQGPPTNPATSTTVPDHVIAEADQPELSPLEAATLEGILDGQIANPCSPSHTAAAGDDSASIVPDDCWGQFPSSHYDIGCDEGAWNHISRKVYCTFTDLAFQGARSATAVALWVVEWAYGFGVYDRLGGSAVELADTYQRDLIGPLGLSHLAWFYAVAWVALALLRGRLTLAGGELLTSIVLALLAGMLVANPAGYLEGTLDTVGTVSGALLATGSGEPPPESGDQADAVLQPLQAQIHRAFVEDPYDHLNWGGTTLPPACAAIRDRILASGPHGNSDGPRMAMNAAGCGQQADFNRDPNGTRLFGAVLTFGAAGIMVVLVALVALTIVVAQVINVVLFALTPFAALAAILPGAGRELAWRWLASVLRVVLAVVGMSFVLSLLLLTIRVLLEGSTGVGIAERFALVNVVVLAMFVARKRLITAGHNLAANMGQRLAARRPGGDRGLPWMAAPAVAGATGFALGASLGPDRSSRTSRATASLWRNNSANRRLRRQRRAADRRAGRRANQTAVRERTEIAADNEGNPHRRRVMTLDGPAARSRRARRARERLEQRHGQRFARAEHARRPVHSWNSDGDPKETSAPISKPGANPASRLADDGKQQRSKVGTAVRTAGRVWRAEWHAPEAAPGGGIVDVEDT